MTMPETQQPPGKRETHSSLRQARERIRQELDCRLHIALEHSFPCSDPLSSMHVD